MGEIAFYHLLRSSVEEALPPLLEKILQRGHRVVLLAGSEERVARLNQHLWTWRRESFLPHGCRADGAAAEQPIWLTEREENPNGATILLAVDGLPLGPVAQFERCLDMFDGSDEEALAAARDRWRQGGAAGHALTYWQQDELGRWQKKR